MNPELHVSAFKPRRTRHFGNRDTPHFPKKRPLDSQNPIWQPLGVETTASSYKPRANCPGGPESDFLSAPLRRMRNKFFIQTVLVMTLGFGLWFLMPAKATAATNLDSATWAGNGHTYHLIAGGVSGNPTGISWTDAEAYAVSALGGHLATVDLSGLDTWIWNTFGNAMNRNLWIGLTDQDIEGQFKWIATGTNLSYSHWYPGEPNNYQNEDYVFLLRSGFVGGNGAGEGNWNDAPGGWTEFFSAPMYAIAETVPEPTAFALFAIAGIAMAFVRKKRSAS